VTRLVGIRYLWIDCLCIIQDDDDDWKRECEKMAGIYENSFFTISALLAKNSGQTIFPNRPEGIKPVLLRMANGTLVGLRPSTLDLTDAVKASVLDERGWILQERVLSPAIIHFGNNQVY
jgi:Heterokaryon incompatibility protein (HET)